MWYNPADMLSYNRLINMVFGSRGGGKSFNTLLLAGNAFVKNKQQFMYVRRYDSEMEKVKDGLFDDIQGKGYLDGIEIKTKSDKIYFNDEIAGYCMPLSLSRHYKSKAFPGVKYIIFDEFLVDKGRTTYLKDEIKIFYDLIETVGRMRDELRVIMLSNAITVNNLYLEYWGMRIPKGAKFVRHPELPIVVQIWAGEDYIKTKENSNFGKLIAGTSYSEYAVHNKFTNDNYEFVEPMQGGNDYIFGMAYSGKHFGVYWQSNKGIIHINSAYNPSFPTRFAFTTEDHKPNYLMFKSAKMNPYIKKLIHAYDIGRVRFDSIGTKNLCYEIFDYIK